MRRAKVCSACGKPTTVASVSCLWCGHRKALFSGRLLASLKGAALFMVGLLTRRGRAVGS